MSIDVIVDLTALDTHSRYSGTGRYIHELAKALFELSPSEQCGLSIAALIAIAGQNVLGALTWPGSPKPLWSPDQEIQWLNARRLELSRTLRKLKPALFHATYHLGTPRGSFVPRVVTCLDLVRLVRHRDYLDGRSIYRVLLHAAEALRFHSARRVLAISEHTANDAMRLLRLPASKIDVVHLGVDLARYRVPSEAEAERASQIRAAYGLREHGYFFYVGAFDPRKNVDVMIAAFRAAALPDHELVLIGKMRPSDQLALDRALQSFPGRAVVRSLGFVPEADLPAIIAGACALVFCSGYEGFGNVPVEAMACGCPVIHTGQTSMRETLGDVGLIVSERNVSATADAIRRIVREPALYRDLRAQGIERAQRFSWRNTALGTVECYARALRS